MKLPILFVIAIIATIVLASVKLWPEKTQGIENLGGALQKAVPSDLPAIVSFGDKNLTKSEYSVKKADLVDKMDKKELKTIKEVNEWLEMANLELKRCSVQTFKNLGQESIVVKINRLIQKEKCSE